MTTITLNNENKTQFNFEYEHGLPYKKSIRPVMEYGDWKENINITLIIVTLSDVEFSLFKEPQEIEIISAHQIDKEYWFDLQDVYLVMPFDPHLQKAFQHNKFLFAFMHQNILVASSGYLK